MAPGVVVVAPANANGPAAAAAAAPGGQHQYDPSRPAATVSLVDDDDPAAAPGGAAGGRATKKKVYHCEVCDKKYATMTNIYKHMRSHQLYLCSLCMRTFAHEYQIKEHRCPQGSVKTPQCQVCFKYLSNSWSLTRHMKIHAHELDDSGNYTAATAASVQPPTAATAATVADDVVATTAQQAFGVTNVVVPNVAAEQQHQQQRMLMMMDGHADGTAGHLRHGDGAQSFVGNGLGGTQLAAADSSSGVVRIHEVDFSEVTSCSLATSCSSDVLQQANGELSMMSTDHSQDYTQQQQLQQQSLLQMQQMQQPLHAQRMIETGAGLMQADLADTTSMDGGPESPAVSGHDGDSSSGGTEVECSVCRKRFKSDSRLLKHQRTVHCGEFRLACCERA